MCGRYASFRQTQDLADIFDVSVVADEAAEVEPSWNVAPTDGVRVVLERSAGPVEDAPPGAEPDAVRRELHVARWGLVPHWAKDVKVGARMINARAESVAQKPAFAAPLRTKRCIVPADGYYEWQKLDEAGKKKQPYYLHAHDEGMLAFAGLYSWWRDPDRPDGHPEAWRLTNTILTTTASDALGHVHDRCPVIVPPAMLADWLNPATTDKADVEALLAAMPEPHLVPRPVGKAVGNVRNDGPQLIEPVA